MVVARGQDRADQPHVSKIGIAFTGTYIGNHSSNIILGAVIEMRLVFLPGSHDHHVGEIPAHIDKIGSVLVNPVERVDAVAVRAEEVCRIDPYNLAAEIPPAVPS